MRVQSWAESEFMLRRACCWIVGLAVTALVAAGAARGHAAPGPPADAQPRADFPGYQMLVEVIQQNQSAARDLTVPGKDTEKPNQRVQIQLRLRGTTPAAAA